MVLVARHSTECFMTNFAQFSFVKENEEDAPFTTDKLRCERASPRKLPCEDISHCKKIRSLDDIFVQLASYPSVILKKIYRCSFGTLLGCSAVWGANRIFEIMGRGQGLKFGAVRGEAKGLISF